MLTKRSDYSAAIRRCIKHKEKYLNRNCWKLWEYTPLSPELSNVTYLFGKFSRGHGDTIIVTVAGRVNHGPWYPQW